MPIEVVKLRRRSSGLGYYSYEITLPKEFIEKLGWQQGDKLLLKLENNKIIIEKPK